MTHEHQQPLNREQRRAQKFRSRSTARQDNLHTQRENDTGFLATPADTLADGPRDVDVAAVADEPAVAAEPDAAAAAPNEASAAADAADAGATHPADQPAG
jgi:hypothetical protein